MSFTQRDAKIAKGCRSVGLPCSHFSFFIFHYAFRSFRSFRSLRPLRPLRERLLFWSHKINAMH
jgi:hypothetical protein